MVVRVPRRSSITVCLAAAVAVVGLAGCTEPTVDPTPTTCTAEAGSTGCQQSGSLRWLTTLDAFVAIETTEEHGLMSFVTAVTCPDGVTADSSAAADWRGCQATGHWVFNDGVIWFVNQADVLGVEADSGVVVERSHDATRAGEVQTLTDDQPDASATLGSQNLAWPNEAKYGLVVNSASQSRTTRLIGQTAVLFQVGCIASSVKDIPGAGVSHGAPIWTQVCQQPVLWAFNR